MLVAEFLGLVDVLLLRESLRVSVDQSEIVWLLYESIRGHPV
jgi:hypothetical protein